MKRNLDAELEAARKEVKQLEELLALKEKVAALSEQLGMDKWPKIQQIPYVPYVPYPIYPIYPQPYPNPTVPFYPRPIPWTFINTGSSTNQLVLDGPSQSSTSISIS